MELDVLPPAQIDEMIEQAAPIEDEANLGYAGRARRLYRVFGLRFMLVAIMIEHVLQGFVFSGGAGGLVGAPIPFLFREFGLPASRIQVLYTIAVSPWALKPLIGILSDTIYVTGYRKMPYMLVTTLGAIVACLGIGLFCPESPVGITALLFFIFLQISVADLLIEAKYAEKTNANPSIKPDIAIFVHLGGYVGRFASVALVGYLIQNVPLRYIYLIPLPFFLIFLYPLVANWIQDQKWRPTVYAWGEARLANLCCGHFFWYTPLPTLATQNDTVSLRSVPLLGADAHKMRDNSRVLMLALAIGAISLFNNAIGLMEIGTLPLMISSVVCALLMILLFFLFIDRRIARVMTFIILQNMFSFDLDTAVFFFYTDNATQYEAGPHFSIFFYVTVMGILSLVLGFVGTAIYGLFMSHWKYQRVFLVSGVLYIPLSLINIVFYRRQNVGVIPDAAFVLGTDALRIINSQFGQLPAQAMMLGLCPPGLEGTVYALLAGTSNLGAGLASYQGAYLLDALSIKPNGTVGESAQFDMLYVASLIDTLVHLVPLIFIPFLIPDASQTEPLLLDEEDAAAEKPINADFYIMPTHDHAILNVSADDETSL